MSMAQQKRWYYVSLARKSSYVLRVNPPEAEDVTLTRAPKVLRRSRRGNSDNKRRVVYPYSSPNPRSDAKLSEMQYVLEVALEGRMDTNRTET
jgi:outer membrane protein assembly factor BamE (lipoprotein component of BamABCDE complex)